MATISGFTQTPQFQSVECMNTLSGGGTAAFTIFSREASEKANYLADLGKTITITETRSGHSIVIWKGELIQYVQITEHLFQMLGAAGGRKLFSQPSNHQQILGTGTVIYVYGDFLNNHLEAPFDVSWDDSSIEKAMVFTKNGLKETTTHPVSTRYTQNTIASEQPSLRVLAVGDAGDINRLSFDTGLIQGPNRFIGQDPALNAGDAWCHELTYNHYKKDGTNFTNMTIKNICSFLSGEYINNCRIEMFNFISGDWEEMFAIEPTNWSTVSTNNPPALTELSIKDGVAYSGTISDYASTSGMGGVNASSFQKHKSRIRLTSMVQADTTNTSIQLFYQHLQVEFDGDQTPSLSQGYLKTASTTTTLAEFDPAQSWALDDFPIADGFGRGDKWVVCDWLDNMIAAIFTDSGTNFTLDWNVTDSENHTDTDGIKHRTIGDLLRKYTNFLNAIFMYEPSDDKIYGRSLDNVAYTQWDSGEPLGVINSRLAVTDIIGGVNGYGDQVDIKNIKTDLQVVGSSFEGSTAITEEYTLTQGVAKEIEVDSSVSSAHLLVTALTKRQFKYKYARRELRMSLDLSIDSAKWINLKVGQWLEALVTNHFSFTTEPLLIYGLGLRWNKETGFKDDIDIILQRRLNS